VCEISKVLERCWSAKQVEIKPRGRIYAVEVNVSPYASKIPLNKGVEWEGVVARCSPLFYLYLQMFLLELFMISCRGK